MRERLFGAVDEAAALDDLRHRQINYDPARAPGDGQAEGHWHVDSAAALVGREPPGEPVPDGPWETARRLVSQYEFADAHILRGVYHSDRDLLGRDMLLEGRFWILRFYLGVRVTGVFDETRDTEHGPERVWGWSYQTLQGHLEQGRLNYEVIKNLATGQVAFRVTGYSRRSGIPNPVVRWGFGVRALDAAALLPQYPAADVPPDAGGAAWRGTPGPGGPAGRHRPGAVRSAATSRRTAGRRPAAPG